MTAILLAILVFTGVVLALVLVLMAARHQLVATGDVAIVINEDEAAALKRPGGRDAAGRLDGRPHPHPLGLRRQGLLRRLRRGGPEGGGALMPTETPFIAPGKAKRGYRLACQVKVKRDMRIELAPEIFNAKEWDCRVISNRTVSSFIKELKLALPEGDSVPFRAGGYMQLRCPPHELSFKEFDIAPEHPPGLGQVRPLALPSVVPEPVERAYSLASFPLEKGPLLFTIRIAFPPGYSDQIPPGIVSSWLFNLKEGDPVTATGPFGEFYAQRDPERDVLHRRRCRHGADALAHPRPAAAAEVDAQDELLVLGPEPVGGLLRRGVRPARGRAPQLHLAPGAVRAETGGQLDRAHRPRPAAGLEEALSRPSIRRPRTSSTISAARR
jgi:Na+-transporting NADH:ubiquinone oxidoreductase subunit F